MIVESAFTILPESIAGLGFQRVKREANAVGAFSFSLLNALHSKNVVDPIQRLQLERPYSSRNVPLPADNRHCDIHIDYGGSLIGSKRLANFGWRYRNFVEAKFLKSYRRTKSGQDTHGSQNSAEVIADLVRLVALVPEPEAYLGCSKPKTSSARYFLVISDHPLSIFINQYLGDLASAFANPLMRQAITLDLTTKPMSRALAARVGKDFHNLKLTLSQCTCFAHFPLDPMQAESCWMLLIRIDAATLELTAAHATHRFTINMDRSLVEGAGGDYRAIRDFVATNLK